MRQRKFFVQWSKILIMLVYIGLATLSNIQRLTNLKVFFKKYSDEEILQGILEGKDDKVLAYLYKETLPMVKKYILNNQGSLDEAKDVFQDAVIRFYNAVKTGTFKEKCSVSSFVFGISKNLWINAAKRKERFTGHTESEFVQDSVNLLEDIISEEKILAVNQLLDKVGNTCAQLLRYSVYDNLSMREICEKMGFRSEDVAKTNNYRCKQKMMKLVEVNPELLILFNR